MSFQRAELKAVAHDLKKDRPSALHSGDIKHLGLELTFYAESNLTLVYFAIVPSRERTRI